jgi:hypothetical protein
MLKSFPGIFILKFVMILMDIKRQINADSELCDVKLHRRLVLIGIAESYDAYFNIS